MRSSVDIEFASLVVPNTASPQFWESNHWQCLMKRSGSGARSALKRRYNRHEYAADAFAHGFTSNIKSLTIKHPFPN